MQVHPAPREGDRNGGGLQPWDGQVERRVQGFSVSKVPRELKKSRPRAVEELKCN